MRKRKIVGKHFNNVEYLCLDFRRGKYIFDYGKEVNKLLRLWITAIIFFAALFFISLSQSFIIVFIILISSILLLIFQNHIAVLFAKLPYMLATKTTTTITSLNVRKFVFHTGLDFKDELSGDFYKYLEKQELFKFYDYPEDTKPTRFNLLNKLLFRKTPTYWCVYTFSKPPKQGELKITHIKDNPFFSKV